MANKGPALPAGGMHVGGMDEGSGNADWAAMAITGSESRKVSRSVTCTQYSAVLVEC